MPIKPASAADRNATASDARAPSSKRDKTSRPNSSRPSQWSHDDGARRAATSICNGSWGASAGTRTAVTMRPATAAAGQARLRHGRSERPLSMASLVAHARVEHGVQQIDGKIEQDEQGRDHEHDALHLGVITLLHGANQEARKS